MYSYSSPYHLHQAFPTKIRLSQMPQDSIWTSYPARSHSTGPEYYIRQFIPSLKAGTSYRIPYTDSSNQNKRIKPLNSDCTEYTGYSFLLKLPLLLPLTPPLPNRDNKIEAHIIIYLYQLSISLQYRTDGPGKLLAGHRLTFSNP